MSEPARQTPLASAPGGAVPSGVFSRLPPWLRPRESEREGFGQLRLIETTLLVIAAVVLASATIYDLVRQTRINTRLTADLATWRHYTGHDYHNLSLDQALLGLTSEREVVCGNTSPGAPGQRPQLCLEVWGPVREGRREVHGGWYLPPRTPDLPKARYGCFGATEDICR